MTTRVTIPVQGLPKDLDGFRIVQISDTHLERVGKRERKALQIANQADADVIALTGDYSGGAWGARTDESSWEFASMVKKLRAKHGVMGVWGDWDYSEVLRTRAVRNGLQPLFNSSKTIRVGDASITFLGIGLNIRDLDKALDGVPEDAVKVLLCHEAIPESVSQAAERGIALSLVGGEHGGQIRLPILGALRPSGHYGRRYMSGLHLVHGSMYLYANRGLGMTNMQVRFLCPPEVTILTLESK